MIASVVVIAVILGLCALGLSIGLIVRGKPLRSCGSAARDAHGNEITCGLCGGKGGECRREKT